MGLISDIFSKKQPKQPNQLDSYILKMLGNNAIYPGDKDETYLKSYMENNDVFTVINKITEPASQVPVFQYDKNGEIIEDGRMLELIKQPNPHQSQGEFFEAMMTFYYLFGNSFIASEVLDAGLNKNVPYRLDVLPPQWVQIDLGNFLNPIKGYSFYPMLDTSVPYTPDRIFHWKEFNPDFNYTGGHLRGQSRLKPLLKTITGSQEGYNSLVKMFQNQGAWGLLNMLDEDGTAQDISKEQKSALKRQFKNDAKKGDITILNSKSDWLQMGLTSVDMQVLKSLGLFKGNFCDAYNVPSQLFSGSQDRTYNNYKEAEAALWRNAIQPTFNAALSGLSKFLAPKIKGEEDTYLQADYSGVTCLQTNMGELITWMIAANVFTGNQILEACGWEKSTDLNMDRILVSDGRVFLDMLDTPPDPVLVEGALKRLGITDYRTK